MRVPDTVKTGVLITSIVPFTFKVAEAAKLKGPAIAIDPLFVWVPGDVNVNALRTFIVKFPLFKNVLAAGAIKVRLVKVPIVNELPKFIIISSPANEVALLALNVKAEVPVIVTVALFCKIICPIAVFAVIFAVMAPVCKPKALLMSLPSYMYM